MKQYLQQWLILIGALWAVSGSGQVGNCDSVTVQEVQINPFHPNQIMVRAGYTDFDNFISYPGFSITDQDDFILALETVNFFGMSIEQIHVLDIIDLEVLQGMPVAGNLELWSFFYDFLECEYAGPFVLWPDQPCVPLRLTINTLAGDTLTARVNATIENSAGAVEAETTLELMEADTVIHWDFCLPQACGYTLELSTDSLVGPGFYYALHYSDFLAVGAAGNVFNDTVMTADFDLYSCTVTSATLNPEVSLDVFPNPATEHFVVRQPDRLGGAATLRVFDTGGRLIQRQSMLSDGGPQYIDCGSWPRGVYLMLWMDAQGRQAQKRLVVQ